jgi:hypothetical protein
VVFENGLPVQPHRRKLDGMTSVLDRDVFYVPSDADTFSAVEQAARLTRCIDSDRKPAAGVQAEWLISSRPPRDLSAQQMLKADRGYWLASHPRSITRWM